MEKETLQELNDSMRHAFRAHYLSAWSAEDNYVQFETKSMITSDEVRLIQVVVLDKLCEKHHCTGNYMFKLNDTHDALFVRVWLNL